jgi:hypothetical protein
MDFISTLICGAIFCGIFFYLCVNDQSGGQEWNLGVASETPLPMDAPVHADPFSTPQKQVKANPIEVAGRTNSAL